MKTPPRLEWVVVPLVRWYRCTIPPAQEPLHAVQWLAMQRPQGPLATPKRILAVAVVLAGLGIAGWSLLHWGRAENVVPTHSFPFRAGEMGEWKAIGGSWDMHRDVVLSMSNERGAKLVAGSPDWANYTLLSDIRFEGVAADMGIIVRSNDETEGTDAYNGYFVGVRSLDGTLVIGRADYGAWVEARPVPIPGGISPSVWYRLRVTAYGCHIAASAQNLSTLQTSWVAFEERLCVRHGRIGLRSLNANGMWRNVSVTGASWSDYQALAQHATSVEQPVVFQGPPWWTPWHVGMLFAGVLGLALLTQLVYFRMQQWKAYAITQERERLAREIHDTMAQSFAGVGYQIQGIRRSVIRDGLLDSRLIADQLSVAYQLVRKCHEEASRTIAMFSASSPLIQENLLGELEKTARKIAGNQIRIVTRLTGSATTLALRLADALIHIGQEAIANAVSHSDPTQLTITLAYEGNNVSLTVEDNGLGFDYRQESAGFGILGMQKRARDVAGNLQIESTPGHGTVVRVTARLQEEKPHERSLRLVKKRLMEVVPGVDSR
jgi:signal transduction histidine kinase